ncbi:Uncharacterized protein M6B38_224995 [Iris pallida]|uniref:Uncharacterized protein n=1 Tax=Iris pallida TaxID=29817 RepID=A0AAX6DVP1_IRIPA|nr:Uncharacterized protein M6B38_224995 [Iris pallida]
MPRPGRRDPPIDLPPQPGARSSCSPVVTGDTRGSLSLPPPPRSASLGGFSLAPPLGPLSDAAPSDRPVQVSTQAALPKSFDDALRGVLVPSASISPPLHSATSIPLKTQESFDGEPAVPFSVEGEMAFFAAYGFCSRR